MAIVTREARIVHKIVNGDSSMSPFKRAAHRAERRDVNRRLRNVELYEDYDIELPNKPRLTADKVD